MRRSMASTIWRFSTTRMLHDYVERMYLPVSEGEVPATADDSGSGGSDAAAAAVDAAVAAEAAERGAASSRASVET